MALPVHLWVDFRGYDREEMMSQWRWLVDESYQPHLVTFLGDVFLTDPNGEVHFLNTLKGTFGRVAGSVEELDEMLEDRETRLNWFPSPFYIQLQKELGTLKDDECYSCDIPMSLGGAMEPANFSKSDLLTHLFVLGQIHHQVKDMPHGTQVEIIIDKPGTKPKKAGGLGGFFKFGK